MTPGDRVPALRKAHAVYERFRRAGRPAPFRVRLADSKYHAQFRPPRPLPAAGGRAPAPAAAAAAIRQARQAAGMTRPRLAAVVGVSARTVGYWEQAGRAPSADNWVQLELALGPLGVVRDRRAGGGDSGQQQEDAA